MHTYLFLLLSFWCQAGMAQQKAGIIIFNGKIATMNKPGEFVEAVAATNGIIIATGSSKQMLSLYQDSGTRVIDAGGRTVIPGLNDSHIHAIREGLHYNSELRWDGVKTLKRAMEMLREQAARTPEGVWIKVIGGWNEYQFEEKRQPTIREINEAVPDKPVFITYLYGKAFVNKKGIEILQYDHSTRYDGSLVELDSSGTPTGMLYAKESPKAIYTTLALTTALNPEERLNSTLHFFNELNRFGLTSVVDAGGGGQHFPDDYSIAVKLAMQGKLSLRVAYYLFAQVAGREFQDYQKWIATTSLNKNDNLLLANGYVAGGAGENLVASAADFENFLEPRIELGTDLEKNLEPVIRLLVKNRWPFRLHATYAESIERELAIFEKINKETPFNGLRWCFDHAETITDEQLKRVKKLGGGIAVQFRMYYQGELYEKLYGKTKRQLPPIRRMLELKVPVGLGSDATRISSYNPWLSIHWAITGKTIGGYQFWPVNDVLTRFEALQLYTTGSAWISGEEKLKGRVAKEQYADLVILSDDYFSINSDKVQDIQALLTVVNGKIVYAAKPFEQLTPKLPEVIPSWSPVKFYGGFQNR